MLLKSAAPTQAPDADVPGWLIALRHFGAAVLAVALIALAVNLLALPVVQAQTQ